MIPVRAVLLGGWTPTYDGDHCAGGHPGFHRIEDVDGRKTPVCNRCGRYMDLRPCGCPGHQSMGRSYCPVRCHQDRREVAAMVRAGVEFEVAP